jgi:Family of unknown function (DUF6174)
MKIRVVLIAVLMIGLASCGSASSMSSTNRPASTASFENTVAIERWQSLKVTLYRFHFAPSCFCLRHVGFVTVTNGAVSAWEPDHTSNDTMTIVGEVKLDELPTIDSLLAEAARAEREATGRVEISYDAATGAPTRAFVDWIKEAIDDETVWAITDFSVLDA